MVRLGRGREAIHVRVSVCIGASDSYRRGGLLGVERDGPMHDALELAVGQDGKNRRRVMGFGLMWGSGRQVDIGNVSS